AQDHQSHCVALGTCQREQYGGLYPSCVGLYGHRAGQGAGFAPGVPHGVVNDETAVWTKENHNVWEEEW
ncbi:MAG: hypothetical protein J6P67_07220, partial [Bacteroidaceae bacterium]|nr:hypothetical protein [Bacteroidaceae bacterium]